MGSDNSKESGETYQNSFYTHEVAHIFRRCNNVRELVPSLKSPAHDFAHARDEEDQTLLMALCNPARLDNASDERFQSHHSISPEEATNFYRQLERDRLQAVKTLLQDFPQISNINEVSTPGATALILACSQSPRFLTPNMSQKIMPSPDLVELLLLEGADVTMTSPLNKRTALHKACYSRHPKIVGELLATNKADPNAMDSHGYTPILMVLLKLSEQEEDDAIACAELLISSLADVAIPVDSELPMKGTVVDLAMAHCPSRTKIIKYFLKLGTGWDPKLQNDSPYPFEKYSLNNASVQRIRHLAKPSADPPYSIISSNNSSSSSLKQQRVMEALIQLLPEVLQAVASGGYDLHHKVDFRIRSNDETLSVSPYEIAASMSTVAEDFRAVRDSSINSEEIALHFSSILLNSRSASPFVFGRSSESDVQLTKVLSTAISNVADSRSLVRLFFEKTSLDASKIPLDIQKELLITAIERNNAFVADLLINTFNFTGHKQSNESYDEIQDLVFVTERNQRRSLQLGAPSSSLIKQRKLRSPDEILLTDASKLKLLSFILPPRTFTRNTVICPKHHNPQSLAVTIENNSVINNDKKSPSKITLTPLAHHKLTVAQSSFLKSFSTKEFVTAVVFCTKTSKKSYRKQVLGDFFSQHKDEDDQLRNDLPFGVTRQQVYDYLLAIYDRLVARFSSSRPEMLSNSESMKKAALATIGHEQEVFEDVFAETPEEINKFQNLSRLAQNELMRLRSAPDTAYDFVACDDDEEKLTLLDLHQLQEKFGQRLPRVVPHHERNILTRSELNAKMIDHSFARKRLENFFRKRKYDKLNDGTVNMLLDLFENHDNTRYATVEKKAQDMFLVLEEKYGPEPEFCLDDTQDFYWRSQESFSTDERNFCINFERTVGNTTDPLLGESIENSFGKHFPRTLEQTHSLLPPEGDHDYKRFYFVEYTRFFFVEFQILFSIYEPQRLAHLPIFMKFIFVKLDSSSNPAYSLFLEEFYRQWKLYDSNDSNTHNNNNNLDLEKSDLIPLFKAISKLPPDDQPILFEKLCTIWKEGSRMEYVDTTLEKSRELIYKDDYTPSELELKRRNSFQVFRKWPYAAELQIFLAKYCPEDEDTARRMCDQHEGRERQMMNDLIKKHGPMPIVDMSGSQDESNKIKAAIDQKRFKGTIFEKRGIDAELEDLFVGDRSALKPSSGHISNTAQRRLLRLVKRIDKEEARTAAEKEIKEAFSKCSSGDEAVLYKQIMEQYSLVSPPEERYLYVDSQLQFSPQEHSVKVKVPQQATRRNFTLPENFELIVEDGVILDCKVETGKDDLVIKIEVLVKLFEYPRGQPQFPEVRTYSVLCDIEDSNDDQLMPTTSDLSTEFSL